MELVVIFVILVGLALLYWLQMSKLQGREHYVDYVVPLSSSQLNKTVDGFLPDAAPFPEGQQALLKDFIPTEVGLTAFTAFDCAAVDRTRQTEIGGQYVQRTNNYKRDYPDNCSAPLTDFVGAIYRPKDGVGMNVPCNGDC